MILAHPSVTAHARSGREAARAANNNRNNASLPRAGD